MKKSKKKSEPQESERTRILKRARLEKGLSMTAVAAELDVSLTAVSSWESGLRNPSPAAIPRYAAVLGITAGELLDILDKK